MSLHFIPIRLIRVVCFPVILLTLSYSSWALDYHRDVSYAEVDGYNLQLDLYLPEDLDPPPPLIVWIHGGAWRGGFRYPTELAWLTDHGYAVASISYRFSQDANFPAQIHDCKGAIRWLRANAAEFGYDPDRIAVAGASAGGMLAALVGTTHDVEELEGNIGGNLDESSRVDAIIDYYGATDFILRSTNQPDKTDKPNGLVHQLLGGGVRDNPDLARSASPAFHVSSNDPPLLIFHGNRDTQVLPDQSVRMVDAYGAENLSVEAQFIEAGHGGGIFYHGEPSRQLLSFLDQHFPSTVQPHSDEDPVLRLYPPDLTSSDSKKHGGQVRATIRRDGNHYLRLMPPQEGKSYTNARLANQKPIQAGHTYRLQFEMRIPANENNGTGQGGLQITLGGLPESGTRIERSMIELQSVAVTSSEWETFTYDWRAQQDYAPGEFRIEFRPHFFRENIQIRSIALTDLGTNPPEIIRQGEAYPGHAPDAPWRTEAEARIREHRMADLAINVSDEWGNPVEGATIEIHMTEHDYLFGTCVKASRITDAGIVSNTENFDREQFLTDNAIYREKLKELFNFVVFENDLKWRGWAGLRADRGWTQRITLDAIDWLADNDFTIKSHTMLWGSWRNSPDYLQERKDDPESLRFAIDQHLIDQSVALDGKVQYADVVNEALSHNDLIEAVGWEEMDDWFRIVHDAMPETQLVINEFDILGNGGSPKRQDEHYALIEQLLEDSAPIDVLGFQSHFWSTRLTPPERLYEIIERFAGFGLPLMVSEFDMNLLDEELQADYTRDFLKLWFSHPATEAFIMWGFWAKAHWFGEPGAMFRADWSPKPNLKAYTDLVFGEWWSDADLTTDNEGHAETRLFKGQFEITVSAPGYYDAFRRVHLEKDQTLPVVLYPRKTEKE